MAEEEEVWIPQTLLIIHKQNNMYQDTLEEGEQGTSGPKENESESSSEHTDSDEDDEEYGPSDEASSKQDGH